MRSYGIMILGIWRKIPLAQYILCPKWCWNVLQKMTQFYKRIIEFFQVLHERVC